MLRLIAVVFLLTANIAYAESQSTQSHTTESPTQLNNKQSEDTNIILEILTSNTASLHTPPNIPPEQSGNNTDNTENKKAGPPKTFWERFEEDPVAYFTAWLVGFTAILAISTIGLWGVTWCSSRRQSRDMLLSIRATERATKATRDSVELARKEFLASNSPRLRVRNIILNPVPIAIKPFAQGSYVSGTYLIFNIGNSEAIIIKHIAKVFWTDKPTLPMIKPYDFEDAHITPITIPAGSYTEVIFKSATQLDDRVPQIMGGTNKLYVMGFITYKDWLDINRRVFFCRVYDPREGCFTRIINEDYENEG